MTLLTTLPLERRFDQLGTAFCFDTETAMAPAAFGGWNHVRLLQFANEEGFEFYLDTLEMGTAEMGLVREALERPELEVLCQNAAFDYRVMRGCGIYLGGKPSLQHLPTLRDTMLASQILHNGKANLKHNLAAIVKRECRVELDKTLQKNNWMEAVLTEEEIAYAMGDVRYTLRAAYMMHPRLKEQGLWSTYELECALIPAVVEMESTGMRLDPVAIGETLEVYQEESASCRECFLETLDGRLQNDGLEPLPRDDDGGFNTRAKDSGALRLGTKRYAGFNINSAQQVLRYFNALGIEPVDDNGKPSLDKKVLARFQSDEVVRMYRNYRNVEKRYGMAQKLCEHVGPDDRIRARFMQLGTGTGRWSCVAGHTLLPTSRGLFRFDEYLPQEGDLVLTHRGRWMPVLRKIFKGTEEMFCVRTDSGAELTCTAGHRLLAGGEWVSVRNINKGDIIDCIPCLHDQSAEHPQGAAEIQGGGQAFGSRDSNRVRYDASQCVADFGTPSAVGRAEGRESVALLTVEDGTSEPYAGQEWFPTPQLQGFGFGLQGLLDRAGWKRGQGVPASACDGGSVGTEPAAVDMGSASHRWGSDEQFLGQPGACDFEGAQGFASAQARVVSITPVGTLGVWDIEVGGDHSYIAGGFFNHNSSGPNLQQIPRDPAFRNAFRAPEGRVIVEADYSAMELRIAAALAGEQKMLDAFNAGRDVHTLTASLMYGVPMDEVEKQQRQGAKSANFGLLYGSGPRGLMNYFATVGIFISLRQATEFHGMWHRAYPAFGAWHKVCQARADAGEEMRTLIGRRRYLYGDDNKVTTQANNVVQGTGADISKAAMVEIHRRLPDTARLLATVHDSYLIECEREDAPAVLSMVLAEMEDAAVPILGNAVRLTGEGGYGPSWGEAK